MTIKSTIYDVEMEQPSWDKDSSELAFKGRMLRKLRKNATTVIPVLDAFQQAGWPEQIAWPIDTWQRVEAIDRALNSGLGPTGGDDSLRFVVHYDGRNGEISWHDVGAVNDKYRRESEVRRKEMEKLPPRPTTAAVEGPCQCCDKRVYPGQKIIRAAKGGWRHVECREPGSYTSGRNELENAGSDKMWELSEAAGRAGLNFVESAFGLLSKAIRKLGKAAWQFMSGAGPALEQGFGRWKSMIDSDNDFVAAMLLGVLSVVPIVAVVLLVLWLR